MRKKTILAVAAGLLASNLVSVNLKKGMELSGLDRLGADALRWLYAVSAVFASRWVLALTMLVVGLVIGDFWARSSLRNEGWFGTRRWWYVSYRVTLLRLAINLPILRRFIDVEAELSSVRDLISAMGLPPMPDGHLDDEGSLKEVADYLHVLGPLVRPDDLADQRRRLESYAKRSPTRKQSQSARRGSRR